MTKPGSTDATVLDRPWKRPGGHRYALSRLKALARPPIDVYEPPPGSVIITRDVAVPTRDGTVLRVNLYRPPGGGPFPVLLSAHPYGKDKLPAKRRFGRGHSVPFQYRVLRQPARVRFSSLTSWEAPDPAWWTAQGYAVLNCDLRGAGKSEGVSSLMSDQEGEDVYDLVEWAAGQPWSTGAVAMIGVSYLAISQWKAAALRPPHLKAIVPWEGMTDPYRDLLRPGGIQEVGFVKLWQRGLRETRLQYDIGQASAARPTYDEFWQSLVADLPIINVPALICGSFSDNNLHSRGSVRAFEQIGSGERHLYTHRGGKWATFYSDAALATQLAFLNRHLRGGNEAPTPRVRLEVRESRDQVLDVRDEADWPLPSTHWSALHLTTYGLSPAPPEHPGTIVFESHSSAAAFDWTLPDDTEISGPMSLRLFLEVAGGDDIDLFVGVEKWRGSQYVPFEGSYGFGRDRVATGWLRASMRALDPQRSRPFDPVPTYATREPLRPGQIVGVDVAIGPSATLFRAGERLRLVVAGRWLWPHNPLTGQFPAAYEKGPHCECTLHWGPEHPAQLLLPFIK